MAPPTQISLRVYTRLSHKRDDKRVHISVHMQNMFMFCLLFCIPFLLRGF